MPRAVVLGGGLVGSVMAADLATDFEVTLVDRSSTALQAAQQRAPGIATREADLSDPAAVTAAVDGADVVCGAMASHLGFATLRAVIEAGRPFCDISFMVEDPKALHALAQERGVPAVVDMGVAPGTSNLLAGLGVARLPLGFCAPALRRGELVHLLPACDEVLDSLWLVYPTRAHPGAKLSAFVRFVRAAYPAFAAANLDPSPPRGE